MFNTLLITLLLFTFSINNAMNEQDSSNIVIQQLLQTDNINAQDEDGNTIAHLLPPIDNKADLTAIFNILVAKDFYPWIQNKQRKTAKDIAAENYKTSHNKFIKDGYRHNKKLFSSLECDLDAKYHHFVYDNNLGTVQLYDTWLDRPIRVNAAISIMSTPTQNNDHKRTIKYGERLEEAFQKFALTRLFKKDNTYFDHLPKEIVDVYFRIPLAQIVSRKFKHRLLNYAFQNHYLSTTNIEPTLNKKVLFRHDGDYTYTPNIGYDFISWDALKKNKGETNFDYTILLKNEHPSLSKLVVCCPTKEHAEKNKIHNLAILYHEDLEHHKFKSPIDRCLSSYNNEWIIFTSSQENNTVAILNATTSQKSEWEFKKPITALYSAHHSPLFAIGSAEGQVTLIYPHVKPELFKFTNHKFFLLECPIVDIQFSPDDSRLFACTDSTLVLYNILNNTKYYIARDIIRKASFSPDGKTIIIAHKDGSLELFNEFTCKKLKQHPIEWRAPNLQNENKQPPLILWAQNSQLLCALDPTNHKTRYLHSFIIHKAKTGKFLYMHNFYPKNPIAMGLTKDENSIVFVLDDNSISIMNLYNENDIHFIDFIENKATLYELCDLLHLCKNKDYKFKFDSYKQNDKNAAVFINAIKDQVKIYQNK